MTTRIPTPARRVPVLQRPLASYYLLLGSAGLLLVIGLLMVLSASSVTSYAKSGSSFTVFNRQALWVGIGLPALWLGMRLPLRTYRWLGYPVLVVSALLLVAVLVPGVGHDINGATRWIDLPGGLQVQPSEVAKLGLSLWGADLLSRKAKLLTDYKHLLVPLVPVAFLLAAFVMLQPDLGTTMVLMLILCALLFVVGAPMRLFGAMLAMLVFLGTLLAISSPYRLERLTSYTDPFADPTSTGFQAVQGLYALSSGGWFGVGLGASRQKWGLLPNANTDYIFAILGEELGLIGTLVVISLFAILGYAGFRIARRATDPFARLVSAAITVWLLGQAMVNIGAVVGLLPITGIPLPLISFGGSALVPTMFVIGMLASFARAEPGAALALAARPSLPHLFIRALRPGQRARAGRPVLVPSTVRDVAPAPVAEPLRPRARQPAGKR